jgi:hypothetical protein
MSDIEKNHIHKDDIFQYIFEEAHINGFYKGTSAQANFHRDLEQGEA